jgi:hypothetical protein
MYGFWYLVLFVALLLTYIPGKYIDLSPMLDLFLFGAGLYGFYCAWRLASGKVARNVVWGYSVAANSIMGLTAQCLAVMNFFAIGWLRSYSWILFLVFVAGLFLDHKGKKAVQNHEV